MYKRLSFQISIPCLCSTCLTDKTGHSGSSTPTSSTPVPLFKTSSTGSAHTAPVPSPSPLVHTQSTGAVLASTTHSPTASRAKTVAGNDAHVPYPTQAPHQPQLQPVSIDQHDSLPDVDDKKGKFKTLRQSFRVIVSHRQRSESINVSNPATAHANTSLSVSTPKAYVLQSHFCS